MPQCTHIVQQRNFRAFETWACEQIVRGKLMASSDLLKIIHATPVFAAKRRGNKARQRDAFERSKALGQGLMESLDPTRVVHLRAQRNANNERLGNLNSVIVQMPRAQIDPRLRNFARLLEESEQGDPPKSK
jgi:hypothetical protein